MLREEGSPAGGWAQMASAQFGSEPSGRNRKLREGADAAGGKGAADDDCEERVRVENELLTQTVRTIPQAQGFKASPGKRRPRDDH